MKKLLLLLVTVFLATTLAAQKGDIIYLKNGSVIKGKITGIADSKVTITAKGGSLFVIGTDEIDRMAKEEKTPFVDFRTPGDKKWSIGATAGYLISSDIWVVEKRKYPDDGLWRPRIVASHGFTVGALGEFRPAKGFGAEMGLMFSMSGYGYKDKPDEGVEGIYNLKVRYYSIDIPVSAVFYFGDKAKWHISLGVKPVLNVGGRLKANDDLLALMREDTVLAGDDYVPDAGDGIPFFNVGALAGIGYGPVRLQAYYMFMPSLGGDFLTYLDRALYVRTKHNNAYGASLTYTYMF